MFGLCAILLLASAGPVHAVPVRLPPGEPAGPWDEVLTLAGLDSRPPAGGELCVQMAATASTWTIRVLAGDREQRRVEVPAPLDVASREAVAWIAASLATPLTTPGWSDLLQAAPPPPEAPPILPPPRPPPIPRAEAPPPAPDPPATVAAPEPPPRPEPPAVVTMRDPPAAVDPPAEARAVPPPERAIARPPPSAVPAPAVAEAPSRLQVQPWIEVEGGAVAAPSATLAPGGRLRIGGRRGPLEASLGAEVLGPAALLDVTGTPSVTAYGPIAGLGLGWNALSGAVETGLAWRRYTQDGELVESAVVPWVGLDVAIRAHLERRVDLVPTAEVRRDLLRTDVHVGSEPEITLSEWQVLFGLALRLEL